MGERKGPYLLSAGEPSAAYGGENEARGVEGSAVGTELEGSAVNGGDEGADGQDVGALGGRSEGDLGGEAENERELVSAGGGGRDGGRPGGPGPRVSSAQAEGDAVEMIRSLGTGLWAGSTVGENMGGKRGERGGVKRRLSGGEGAEGQ